MITFSHCQLSRQCYQNNLKIEDYMRRQILLPTRLLSRFNFNQFGIQLQSDEWLNKLVICVYHLDRENFQAFKSGTLKSEDVKLRFDKQNIRIRVSALRQPLVRIFYKTIINR